MIDTEFAANAVNLAPLEGQLLAREINFATFIKSAENLDLPDPAIVAIADKFMAIDAHQAARRPTARYLCYC